MKNKKTTLNTGMTTYDLNKQFMHQQPLLPAPAIAQKQK